MPEKSTMTQLHFINTSGQQQLLGTGCFHPCVPQNSPSSWRWADAAVQDREVSSASQAHSFHCKKNSPGTMGRIQRKCYLLQVTIQTILSQSLEIQLPKRRNDYVFYSQSFVSILGFSASLEKPLQHVTAERSMNSVKHTL